MKLDITLEIDNQTDKTISFDGINLTIYDPKTSKTYTFHPNGDIDFLVDPRKILEDELDDYSFLDDSETIENLKLPPSPPELMTLTQIRGIMQDKYIDEFLGLPDRSFHKYWIKNSPITNKWHFNKVIFLIRHNKIPLRFTSYFWNNYFYTKDAGYLQTLFSNLKTEVDELIKNQS